MNNNDGKTLYLALYPDLTPKHWVALDASERMRFAAAEKEVEEGAYEDGYGAGKEEGYDEGYEAARGESSFDDEE
jgi:flagellar biosynthesis/type III secretory pathway protein FliH